MRYTALLTYSTFEERERTRKHRCFWTGCFFSYVCLYIFYFIFFFVFTLFFLLLPFLFICSLARNNYLSFHCRVVNTLQQWTDAIITATQ